MGTYLTAHTAGVLMVVAPCVSGLLYAWREMVRETARRQDAEERAAGAARAAAYWKDQAEAHAREERPLTPAGGRSA